MLDLTGIMFSSVMMLIVIIRALRLDRIQPWFQTVKALSAQQDRAWNRRR
jgi:hypothetical protein